jgi:hypothetical protein
MSSTASSSTAAMTKRPDVSLPVAALIADSMKGEPKPARLLEVEHGCSIKIHRQSRQHHCLQYCRGFPLYAVQAASIEACGMANQLPLLFGEPE